MGTFKYWSKRKLNKIRRKNGNSRVKGKIDFDPLLWVEKKLNGCVNQ